MTQTVTRQPQGGMEEQSAGGLIIHRGPLNAAVIRAIGSPATGQPVYPRDGYGSGNSLELQHTPKVGSTIVPYDRDTGQFLDLWVYGKNIRLMPQGGSLLMPAGSAWALLGSYTRASNWGPPQNSVWTESDAQVNVTFSGVPVRIDFTGGFTADSSNPTVLIGIGVNGGLNFDSVIGATVNPGWLHPFGGSVIYSPPSAGPGRVSIFMYGSGPGCHFHNWVYERIWVTEQRA